MLKLSSFLDIGTQTESKSKTVKLFYDNDYWPAFQEDRANSGDSQSKLFPHKDYFKKELPPLSPTYKKLITTKAENNNKQESINKLLKRRKCERLLLSNKGIDIRQHNLSMNPRSLIETDKISSIAKEFPLNSCRQKHMVPIIKLNILNKTRNYDLSNYIRIVKKRKTVIENVNNFIRMKLKKYFRSNKKLVIFLHY